MDENEIRIKTFNSNPHRNPFSRFGNKHRRRPLIICPFYESRAKNTLKLIF